MYIREYYRDCVSCDGDAFVLEDGILIEDIPKWMPFHIFDYYQRIIITYDVEIYMKKFLSTIMEDIANHTKPKRFIKRGDFSSYEFVIDATNGSLMSDDRIPMVHYYTNEEFPVNYQYLRRHPSDGDVKRRFGNRFIIGTYRRGSLPIKEAKISYWSGYSRDSGRDIIFKKRNNVYSILGGKIVTAFEDAETLLANIRNGF